MSTYFENYVWRGGIPYGIHPTQENAISLESYKIVADPYRKRISIEKYKLNKFQKTLYDSSFLDFRTLKPQEQRAWHRELIEESEEKIIYLMRDQNDRVLFYEVLFYQEAMCRRCHIQSIYGDLLSQHALYYSRFGDTFDGVVLRDSEERIVMFKKYQLDSATGDFAELILEDWNYPEESFGKAVSTSL